MTEYISRNTAICIADYAADEHPYDKDPAKPETFSEYNQGWNDACDYIRERLENTEKADVAPVRRGRWIEGAENFTCGNHNAECSVCHCNISWNGCDEDFNYCPNCGARMDGGTENA